MTGTVTWIVLVALGFGIMALIKITPDKLDPVMERLGAALFMGGGMVGATGWLGDVMRSVTGWITSTADRFGQSMVGDGIVWLLAAGLAVLWIGAFLPRTWFQYDYPDWLMISGFFLPGFMVAVPGLLGDGLRTGTELAGNGAVELVSMLISG